MRTGVVVTNLEYETTEGGTEVIVTAHRIGGARAYIGRRADASDLPPDVADELRRWLEGAPTTQPPQ